MTINLYSPTTFVTSVLIGDTSTFQNVSSDGTPHLTQVNGVTVSAALEIQSTEGALLFPRMTTVERDALVVTNGMMIYNNTGDYFNFYENNAWKVITGSVIPPGGTTPNDIAIFTDTSGTLGDSNVPLYTNGDAGLSNTIYMGPEAGNTGVRAGSVSNVVIGCLISSDLAALSVNNSVVIGNNIATGIESLQGNIIIGQEIATISTGSDLLQDLIILGHNAGEQIQGNSSQSILIGPYAGRNIPTVNSCIMIGYNAGNINGNQTCVDCIFIGVDSDALADGLSNATAIGPNSRVSTSDSLVLGSLGTKVGINTTSPSAHFDNKGGASVSTTTLLAAADFPYTAVGTDQYIFANPATLPVLGSYTIFLPEITADNLGRRIVVTNLVNSLLSDLIVSGAETSPGVFQPCGPANNLNGQNQSYSATFVACNDPSVAGGPYIWRTSVG